MTTIVDDIDSRPPRKTLSIRLQDIAWAVTKPRMKTPMNFVPAATRALEPTLRSFLKLNSSPRPNIRKIIPISDHWLTVSWLVIPGKKLMCGPTRSPAMM